MTLAVLVARAAAGAGAGGPVREHRAASSVPVDRSAAGPFRLVWTLLRTPRWLVAVSVGVSGLALQALALGVGSVVVVQPVLASGLVIALVIGFLVDRRHPDRPLPSSRQWLAALVVVVGLALFLLAAAPDPGRVDGSGAALALCTGVSLLLSVGAVAHARRGGARHAPLVLGLATGSAFGAMTLVLNALVSFPLAQWLTTWHTAGVVVLGASGVLLSQLAYQAGPLTASLPALTVAEPRVALGAAGPVFGEALAPGLLAHCAQGAGAVMLLAGLVVLARSQAAPTPDEPPRVAARTPGAVVGEDDPLQG